jgi:hypothetical protein
MRRGLVVVAVAASVIAVHASASLSASSSTSVSTGSCPAPTVAAVVDETFVCLAVGGACTARFQDDYGKYQLSCEAGKLVRKRSGSSSAGLADAFLNTNKGDLSTHLTSFKLSGPPPVVHLTFRQALVGTHKLSLRVRNATIGASSVVDSTLQSGWQYTYQVLPASASDATAGTYRVAIVVDGTGRKELVYSVKP